MQFFDTDGFKSSEGKLSIVSVLVYVAGQIASALGWLPNGTADQLEGALWAGGVYTGWRTLAKVGGQLAQAWKLQSVANGKPIPVSPALGPDIDPVLANDSDAS